MIHRILVVLVALFAFHFAHADEFEPVQGNAELLATLQELDQHAPGPLYVEARGKAGAELEAVATAHPDVQIEFVEAGTPTLRTACRVVARLRGGGRLSLSASAACDEDGYAEQIGGAGAVGARALDLGTFLLPVDPRTAYRPRRIASLFGATVALAGLTSYSLGFAFPYSFAAVPVGFILFTVALPIQYGTALDGARVIRRAGLRSPWALGATAAAVHALGLGVVGLSVWVAIASMEGGSPIVRPLFYAGGAVHLASVVLGIAQVVVSDRRLRVVETVPVGSGRRRPVALAFGPLVTSSGFGIGLSLRF